MAMDIDTIVGESRRSGEMTAGSAASAATFAATAVRDVAQAIAGADVDPQRGALRIGRRVRGLDGFDGYRGRLKCGRAVADVRIEPGDWIRVHLALGSFPLPPRDALAAGAVLPGNVRFAFRGGAACLVGDSRLDGMAHLPASLGEIRRALSRRGRGSLLPRQSSGGAGSTRSGAGRAGAARFEACRSGAGRAEAGLDAGKVQEILEDLPFGEDAVVRLEGGWELRPRLGEEPQPIRATIEAGGFRLSRAFPWDPPEGPAAEAVALEALRINDEIRFARLALDGGGLVAEATLHAGILDAPWVALAARAVCHAYRHALLPLGVLHEPPVAAAYLRVHGPARAGASVAPPATCGPAPDVETCDAPEDDAREDDARYSDARYSDARDSDAREED
jgi:hypothetical protein